MFFIIGFVLGSLAHALYTQKSGNTDDLQATAPAVVHTSSLSLTDALAELKELVDRRAITDDEYCWLKAAAISRRSQCGS